MAKGRADDYREKAEECRLQAERAKRDDDKASWLKLAANGRRWPRRRIRLRNKLSNLKPKSRPEKCAIGTVANFDGELSADCPGDGILRQVGETPSRLVARRLYAVELKSLLIADEMGIVARVEEVARHVLS